MVLHGKIFINMIQIQPITFPIKGTATQMSVLVLNFATNATTATTYWQLYDENGTGLLDGNYTMTEEQFAAWGTDNNIVNKYVADAIGVTIIS
jgi:hypothetical protein